MTGSSTSSSALYRRLVRRVFLDADLQDSDIAERVRRRLPHAELAVISGKEEIPPEDMRQNSIYVTRDRGSRFGRCPGTPVHRCCNYHTVDVYEGCSLGCSYCIMKSYLNFAPLTVYVDTESVVDEIRHAALAQPERFFRVGSGEVGDSLLLDPVFELTAAYIRGLADLPNVAFEAKTKTSFVDHLLEVKPKGDAVIGFSLNQPEFSAAEEGFAAANAERISAAQRAAAAGYRVAFHFDPIVRIPGWGGAYASLVERLAGIRDRDVAWISLGTIRFTAGLRDRIGLRDYMLDEYVPGRDGKLRYLQRERVDMYRLVLESLRSVFPSAPVYLCMESEAVWRRVFGAIPEDIPELRTVFDAYSDREDG